MHLSIKRYYYLPQWMTMDRDGLQRIRVVVCRSPLSSVAVKSLLHIKSVKYPLSNAQVYASSKVLSVRAFAGMLVM